MPVDRYECFDPPASPMRFGLSKREMRLHPFIDGTQAGVIQDLLDRSPLVAPFVKHLLACHSAWLATASIGHSGKNDGCRCPFGRAAAPVEQDVRIIAEAAIFWANV
jgi:hypothetical protein